MRLGFDTVHRQSCWSKSPSSREGWELDPAKCFMVQASCGVTSWHRFGVIVHKSECKCNVSEENLKNRRKRKTILCRKKKEQILAECKYKLYNWHHRNWWGSEFIPSAKKIHTIWPFHIPLGSTSWRGIKSCSSSMSKSGNVLFRLYFSVGVFGVLDKPLPPSVHQLTSYRTMHCFCVWR